MSTKNSPTKYSEDFKKTTVTLYQSGKTYAEIRNEYGVSSSALSNWVRKYSQVQVDDGTVLTAQQFKALQRRNAELEEEELDRRRSQTIEQLKLSLLSYIAGFYNPIRPHSHNHGLSPNERESQAFF